MHFFIIKKFYFLPSKFNFLVLNIFLRNKIYFMNLVFSYSLGWLLILFVCYKTSKILCVIFSLIKYLSILNYLSVRNSSFLVYPKRQKHRMHLSSKDIYSGIFKTCFFHSSSRLYLFLLLYFCIRHRFVLHVIVSPPKNFTPKA